jgi:hypothetical protein
VTATVAAAREYVEIWRTDDCAAYESVYVDQNGVTCSELVIWDKDGSRYREVIGGVDLTTIRRDWEAARAFDKVQVPDDAGRKCGRIWGLSLSRQVLLSPHVFGIRNMWKRNPSTCAWVTNPQPSTR